jgi:hypothetical protein
MRPPYIPPIAAILVLLLTGVAFAESQEMTPWDNASPLKPGTVFGPLKVASVKNRRDSRRRLGGKVATFVDSAGRRGELAAAFAFGDVYATLGAGRIDPDSPKAQVLLTDYSGGAHCCTHYQLLDWIGGTWRTVDLGTRDGEPLGTFPTDVDGDGVADVLDQDDRFAYAFGCYACSWMPPRIFNVRKGQVIDVSAEPRYRKLFEADYPRAKEACGRPTEADSNAGYCAGVVADGARLGRSEEAWAFALAHLKTYEGDVFPGCRAELKARERCPTEAQYTGADDFRPALSKFLAEKGYASVRSQVPR